MLSRLTLFISEHVMMLLMSFILLAAGYLSFLQWWYWGEVRIYFSEFPATVRIENQGEFSCNQSSCVYKLLPKTYQIAFQKEGYEDEVRVISVPWKKIIEENITFRKKSIQLSESFILAENQVTSNSIIFPLEKSSIGSGIKKFSLHENEVLWDKIPLSHFARPVRVVSDEVGRGVWMVSEEQVKKFSRFDQSLQTVVQKNIIAFSAQEDGGFILQDISSDYWQWKNGKLISLSLHPLSIDTICSTHTNIIFLSSLRGGVSIEQYISSSGLYKNIGELENLNESDIEVLKCLWSGGAKVFLKNGKVLEVGF